MTAERELNGHWDTEKERITLFRPLGYVSEVLEGPFAGSKWVLIYRPKGGTTQVDVYGEFVSSTMTSDSVRSAVLAAFERDFNEDAGRIRAFERARESPQK